MEKKPMGVVKPISLGPWGGNGGSKWTQNEDGESTLAGMIICYEKRIDSIVVKSVIEGNTVYSEEFGKNYGFHTEKITFDYPHEYVKTICGYYGPLEPKDPVTIRSLTIITNVTKYGPFGLEEGTYFNLPMENGMIVGFYGRSGAFLDAIGVYVKPLVSDPKGKTASGQTHIPRISIEKELTAAPGLGPWGGAGGRPFEDGVFSGIRKISVYRDDYVVHSIVIEYDRSGKSILKKHGGDGGDIVNEVYFDYPIECLISISGFYGVFDGHEVVKSLSFYTNDGSYGPFGNEAGLFFSSREVDAIIVGFHGRSGLYLDAIGVVREYFKSSYHGMLIDTQLEVERAIAALKSFIEESVIRFAMQMRSHPGGGISQLLDTLLTEVLPRAFATLEEKVAFVDHLEFMQLHGGCFYQRRCLEYGLPICCLCEHRSPFFPPGYVGPLVVNLDAVDAQGWDDSDD